LGGLNYTLYYLVPLIQKHHDLITALYSACLERDRYCDFEKMKGILTAKSSYKLLQGII